MSSGFPRRSAFALIALPVVGLMLRANWARMPELLVSDSALDALRLSLETAAISTALCIVLGGPLAAVLARGNLPGLPILRSVVLLPLVLPPVVGGLALLYLLGRSGLVGQALDLWFGITVPFTTAAVVLAQTFVALPFLVVSLEGALRTAGQRYEAVAATLGASPTLAFRRVTVPLVLPGLASGTVLAFARCLGEFGATTAFAGSLQGTTRTLPLLVYLERETDVDAAVALSLVLVVVAVAGDRGDPPAARGAVVTARRRTLRDHAVPCCIGGDAAGLDARVVVRRPDVHARRHDHRHTRRGDRRAGPQRRGQVHAARRARRAAAPVGGARAAGRRRRHRRAAAPPRRRAARPAGAALPAHDGAGQRRVRAAGARRAPAARPRSGPGSCSTAVDAAALEARRPAQMSGGQQQRVALARALAPDPDLLLLDEPLAALDVDAAPAMRSLLRRIVRDRKQTAVLVTHAALDALVLADRVVVLTDGRVVEYGPRARGAGPPAQRVHRADRGPRPRARRRRGRRACAPPTGRRWRAASTGWSDGEPAVAVFPPVRGRGVRRAAVGQPAQRAAGAAGRAGAGGRPRAAAGGRRARAARRGWTGSPPT